MLGQVQEEMVWVVGAVAAGSGLGAVSALRVGLLDQAPVHSC